METNILTRSEALCVCSHLTLPNVVDSCAWQQQHQKSQQKSPKKQMNRPANTHAPLLTTRDRSLDTAVRPRKNAIAGALCYHTCADTATKQAIPSGHRSRIEPNPQQKN
jgi:adenine-specific DNA glycosylase